MCGLMNETNQVHITAGDVFHEGLRLISLAPAMRVCISEQLKEKLEIFRESQDMFVVEKCKSFKIDVRIHKSPVCLLNVYVYVYYIE